MNFNFFNKTISFFIFALTVSFWNFAQKFLNFSKCGLSCFKPQNVFKAFIFRWKFSTTRFSTSRISCAIKKRFFAFFLNLTIRCLETKISMRARTYQIFWIFFRFFFYQTRSIFSNEVLIIDKYKRIENLFWIRKELWKRNDDKI